MKNVAFLFAILFLYCSAIPNPALAAEPSSKLSWPAGLPVYDHVVIVVEENKDFEEIIGKPVAPFINGTLKAEGANLTRMYGEEHHSEGNYFWLLSGSSQGVGFYDRIPSPITARNLAEQLIATGHTFKGYSEDLPRIGAADEAFGLYARKHVPWVSFTNIPNEATAVQSSNLRFLDFPKDFHDLPTVAFVIPDLVNDMHDGSVAGGVQAGDNWLREHLKSYYEWAKQNNSLLILTFDESDHGFTGTTDPADPNPAHRNRIVTILAGAHIKPGDYGEKKGVNHVTLLRTLEAMYGLDRSGVQQPAALNAGIPDDRILTDIFEVTQPGPAKL